MSELERYVLASLIQTDKQQLAYILREDDFQDKNHRLVFRLIRDRLDKNQKIDATLLNDPSLDKSVAAFSSLSDMLIFDVTRDSCLLKAKIDELCEKSDLRYAMDKAKRLVASISSGKLSEVNHVLDFITNLSDDLIMRHPREVDVSLGSSVLSALKRIEERKHQKKISTGIKQIDQFLYGGIDQGEFVIFAARPNVGKSVFSIMPAISTARAGLDVLIAVNEMDKEQTSIRMLSNLSGVNINAIEGNIPFLLGDGESLATANDEMKAMPLTFIENAYRVSDVERVLQTRRRLNKPVKLVIVDMAGRMTTEKQTRTEREQLNDVSRHLTRLAKEYKCTVIGTVQISRAGLMSEEPQLEHLKETGKWEEDADKVFMMWSDKEDFNKRYIALRKNRTGRKDVKFTVRLDGNHMRFLEDEIRD